MACMLVNTHVHASEDQHVGADMGWYGVARCPNQQHQQHFNAVIHVK